METRVPLALTQMAWIGLPARPAKAPLDKNNLAPP
jgi:hypothetical protein